jgi:hypothetical protein
MSPRSRRMLRFATFAMVAIGALFWLAAMAASLSAPPGRRDGYEAVGIIFASIYALVLVLPPLVFALLDRWPIGSFLLSLTAVAIGLHAVFPWAPVGLIGP